MDRYLLPSAFRKQYPLAQGPSLGKGVTGSVYRSGDYAVKEIQLTKSAQLTSAMSELSVYSSRLGPGIIQLRNWTLDNTILRLAFPRGEAPWRLAPLSARLPVREAALQLLTAVAALHSKGIAHGDIKEDNLVMVDGKLTLIDFGNSRVAYPVGPDGNPEVYGAMMTLGYRDPAYHMLCLAPLQVELYSVAVVLGKLYVPSFRDTFDFKSKELAPIADLMRDLITPLRERKSTLELLHSHFGIKIEPSPTSTPLPPLPDLQPVVTSTELATFIDTHGLIPAYQERMGAQEIFWMVSIFRHCLPTLAPDFLGKDTEKARELLIGCRRLGHSLWSPLVSDGTAAELAATTASFLSIASCLEGDFYRYTYWDFATCAEDLPILLSDLKRITYQPRQIRVLPPQFELKMTIPGNPVGLLEPPTKLTDLQLYATSSWTFNSQKFYLQVVDSCSTETDLERCIERLHYLRAYSQYYDQLSIEQASRIIAMIAYFTSTQENNRTLVSILNFLWSQMCRFPTAYLHLNWSELGLHPLQVTESEIKAALLPSSPSPTVVESTSSPQVEVTA